MIDKKERFRELLNNKELIILDGAMGTMLQNAGLELGKLPEALNITHPEEVQKIHEKYIEAGSDIIYSCSFGVNSLKTSGTEYTAPLLIEAAVKNALAAVKASGNEEVLVALDIGPCGKMLEPNGDLTFEDAYALFKEEVEAGRDAGADLIVIETMTDLYEMRTALLAAKENSDLPVICTMTFEENNRTFTGTCISSMALVLEGLGADAIGINCSLGPNEFIPLIEELSKWTTLPIVAKPNAGLPDPETGLYAIDGKSFAKTMLNLIPLGLKMAGACCGSDPEFIEALSVALKDRKYKKQNPDIPSAVATPEKTVIIDRPRIIGERINPTGKKLLKEAYREGNIDYILELAAKQIEEGAEILDVNAGVPGIDEGETIVKVVKALQGVCDAPLQIDSNNPDVIEGALRVYCGKAIVNSVNGEEKSMEKLLPIVKKYGAAVVGLTLDEEGIPKTCEKRMEIAGNILKRATELGIAKRDVYIDCLTLTVSAEQENAGNTLKALREVKEELGLKTVLGVSNISFGLPNRPLINKNFLQMALTSGLDLPIINPGDREMVRAVDVYNLIMNHDKGAEDYLKKYSQEIDYSRHGGGSSGNSGGRESAAAAEEGNSESAEEGELGYAIGHGLSEKARALTEEALEKEGDSFTVINNHLIPVLDKAGEDFEKGRIFIPQLILCATTAQSAFDAVKEYMERKGTSSEKAGTIVVATVKGDIHDIGKNIVKVILENYGYDIIDLGKDVDPEIIVNTVDRENIRLLGLSALMTTTLPSMEETIKLVKANSPECRIMAGGAVLTEDYALKIGADFYVKDAKASCDRAKEVFEKERH